MSDDTMVAQAAENGEQDGLHPAAVATAEWWAGHLFDHATPGRDAGIDDGMAVAAILLASLAAPMPGEGKRAAFVQATARHITKRLEGANYGVSMSTDYAPDGCWDEIIQAAGVSPSAFPWKTRTVTTPRKVTAKCGYGASDSTIWTAGAER